MTTEEEIDINQLTAYEDKSEDEETKDVTKSKETIKKDDTYVAIHASGFRGLHSFFFLCKNGNGKEYFHNFFFLYFTTNLF